MDLQSLTSVFSISGTTGHGVQLVSNHFRLLTVPDFMLYQYDVTFSPDVVSRRLRFHLVNDHRELLGETRAFDGMQLFLLRKLEQKVPLVKEGHSSLI